MASASPLSSRAFRQRAVALLAFAFLLPAYGSGAEANRFVDPAVAPALELGRHSAPVSAIVPLPDGGWASAGYDGTVRRWNDSGKLIATLRFDPTVGVSEQDRQLGILGLLSVADGKLAAVQRGAGPIVWAFDADLSKIDRCTRTAKVPFYFGGGAVAVDGGHRICLVDGTVHVLSLDPLTGSTLGTFDPIPPAIRAEPNSYPRALFPAYDPKSKRLALLVNAPTNFSGAPDWSLLVLDASSADLKEIARAPLPRDAAYFGLSTGGNGRFVVPAIDAQRHGQLFVWSSGSSVAAKPVTFSGNSRDYPTTVTGTSDRYVLGSALGETVEYDSADRPTGRQSRGRMLAVTALAYTSGGSRWLIGTRDGRVFRSDSEGSGALPNGNLTNDLAWSQDGRALIWKTLGEPPRTVAYNLEAGALASEAPSPNPADALKQADTKLVIQDPWTLWLEPRHALYTILKQRDRIGSALLAEDGRVIVALQSGQIAALSVNPQNELHRDGTFASPGPAQCLALSPDRRMFAAAFDDGFVRIYRTDVTQGMGQPLASIYVDPSGEWVAWNESTGVYTCSVQGDRLFGYQVGHGEEAGATFAPAQSLAAKYRKTDWIAKALFDSQPPSPPDALPVEKVAKNAPVIEILEVEGGKQNAAGEWELPKTARNLQVRVRNLSGGRASWSVRPGWAPPTARDVEKVIEGAETTLRYPLDSSLGSYIVQATVDGLTSEEKYVKVRRETDGKPVGALRILAVGVSDYSKTGLRNLAARRDAEEFAVTMKDPGLKTEDLATVATPVVLTDENATRESLLKALDDIAKDSTPDDLFVFFIAGHGDTLDGRAYVALSDFRKDQEQATSLPWTAINERLGRIKARSKVAFVDTCRAGAGAAVVVGAVARDEAGREMQQNSVVVIASCKTHQLSYDRPDNLHGVFTGALLDALRSTSIDWADKVIKTTNLQVEIEKILRAAHFEQQPDRWAPPGVEVGVARARSRASAERTTPRRLRRS